MNLIMKYFDPYEIPFTALAEDYSLVIIFVNTPMRDSEHHYIN